MTRPSELNPDYVKFANDKKKKKDTVRHMNQRLKSLDHEIENRWAWVERDKLQIKELCSRREKLYQEIIDLQRT